MRHGSLVLRVPVLTYHSVNIAGDDYARNDHVAFAADLEAIHAMGLRIVPAHVLVDALSGQSTVDLDRAVVLTCDDGCDLDFRELVHPTFGPQLSFHHAMLGFRSKHGTEAQPGLHLTSFVIADPEARQRMERECLAGQPWMGEHWWRDARDSGLFAIENHSYDHNHPCLDSPGPHGLVRGDFHVIGTDAQAEFEIGGAQRYLADRLAPHQPSLFCYPFGHANEFLRNDWLPKHGPEIGLKAAFGDGAQPVTANSDRWNLPRYVCGWHWRDPDALAAILSGEA